MTKKTVEKPPKRKQLRTTNGLMVGGISSFVIIGILVSYTLYYSNRALPHVVAAGVKVSGKTLPDVVEALQDASESRAAEPIQVKIEDTTIEVHAADMGLVIDVKATAKNAYAIGRHADFGQSIQDYLKAPFMSTATPFVVTYDEQKLQGIVDEIARRVDTPEINAGVKIENGKVIETQGEDGKRISKDELKASLANAWKENTATEIRLLRSDVHPLIATGDTKEVVSQANALRQVKFTLLSDKDPIIPKQSTVDSWITSELYEGSLRVALNKEAVKAWLEKTAPQINADTQEAKLVMKDGVVSILQAGFDGKTVDIEKTADALSSAVRDFISKSPNQKRIDIIVVMQVTKPLITESSLSTLGISELIGTASTSFVGSPENRKHNIAIGARALNGILLKPGEEFSTLKYLGKIDGAAGYLPELVIKVDKTEPEFGGGLCQVSTTLFRATMNTGLKVTERRNHRYRVGYYEPPVGMDATIYEGSPDYKFVNDTASNILIQSHIEGTKITFEMYGKKDGRHSELTTPTMYDVIEPPEPEYIQTDTLPEGTTKQTEKAHAGASASFVYTVVNSDGSVRNKQTFVSKYVPWRARYLVGTKKKRIVES